MKRNVELPPRDRYHHGDLPAAIVLAAIAILAEEGEDALSVRAVARRVGVDHSAAYRHFEDKRALLAAIAERGFRELTVAIRAALERVPEDDASAQLLALATAYVEFAIDRSALFRVMLGPRLNEDGRFPALEAAIVEPFDLLKTILEGGMARGELALTPVFEAAGCVWAAAHGFALLVLGGRIRVRRDRLAAYVPEVLAPVVRGLATR